MSQESAPAAATPVPFPRTFREAVAQFFGDGRSAHPLIQFVKYGFAGGLATLVNIIAFTLAAWFLFPCFTADDPILTLLHVTPPPVDESSRALYASYANFTGFIVSDVFCYLVNRRFVFVPGRMKVWAEFLSFTAVAGLAILVGTGLMYALVRWLGIATSYGFLANMIASALFNYVFRKFVIFRG